MLILVHRQQEQRHLSDIFLELNCLSFKFAVDVPHVFKCLEEKRDYHILILDQAHENVNLLSKLRQANPQLMVIFLAEQQEPTPPPEKIDLVTHTLLKPPSIQSMQQVLVSYISPK